MPTELTKERVSDWVRLYRQSPLKYEMNTLISVLKNDGEGMLREVLKALKLERSLDLVKEASERN